MECGQARRREEQREKESPNPTRACARTAYLKCVFPTSPLHRRYFSLDGAPPADVLSIYTAINAPTHLILQVWSTNLDESARKSPYDNLTTWCRIWSIRYSLVPTIVAIVRGYRILEANVPPFRWAA